MNPVMLELCPKCGINFAAEPHECPYSVEIYEDYEKECTCCEDCEHECLMDI
jgi:hypothetical protein